MIAAGAEDIEAPSVEQSRYDFDMALIAEPVPVSPRARMLRELGVA
jgi:hypothetical protein